jgi:hypothetical protein
MLKANIGMRKIAGTVSVCSKETVLMIFAVERENKR